MKNLITILLLLFVILPVGATELTTLSYPDRSGFGSNQWYSVFLDGEGEVSVAAKLQIYNTGKDPLDSITVEIPGTSVRILLLLQEVQTVQQQCVRWETICAAYSPDSVCTAWGPGGPGDCVKFEKPCMRQERRCEEYKQVIGQPYNYIPLDAPKETLSKSTKITIPLEQKIASQKQGTLLIYYKSANVAEKSAGVWNFDVETLKWGFDTNQVRVAVNVEPNFFLKGQSAEVEYRPAAFGAFAAASEMAEAEASKELSAVSNRIMYEPGWVRETRGLDPWESFHVTGEYAESEFALHKGSIFLTLLVIVGLILGGIFVVRKLIKVRIKTGTPATVILAGFVSSIVLIVSWVLIVFMLENVSQWVNYRFTEIIIPILLLVSVVWFLVLVFGPGLFVGLRTQSILAGVFTLVSTILWLVLLLIGLIIFFGVIGSSPMLSLGL